MSLDQNSPQPALLPIVLWKIGVNATLHASPTAAAESGLRFIPFIHTLILITSPGTTPLTGYFLVPTNPSCEPTGISNFSEYNPLYAYSSVILVFSYPAFN